jgi:DNA-binding NarL/FixJ family response regulator/signal transduction histidine kinase/ligand-binding sensor domain-containing protein
MLALLALENGYSAATILAEGYSLRVWQTEDGLPENLVTSAAQTKDGYLWFGTFSGLVRFDGERFRVFNSTNTPEMPDRRVVRLFADSHDTLWIGDEAGHVSRYRQDRLERVMPPRSLQNERIIGLGSDEHGAMWALRENGAVDSLEQDNRLPSLLGTEPPGMMGWSRGAGGNIWLWENNRAAGMRNGRLVPLEFPSPQDDPYVAGLAGAADGGVWLLNSGRIRKYKDGRWRDDRGAFPWPPATIACALELRDGTLAVGTVGEGLYLVFGDGRPAVHFGQLNGLPQNWVRFLFEDREGTLWAGSGNSGLVSIRSSPFAVLAPPDRWQGTSVLSVAAGRDGSLWVGTDGAGLYRHNAGQWNHHTSVDGNSYICGVTVTPAGDVWAAPYWWGGPYRLVDGRFIRPAGVDPKWGPAFALVAVPGTDELLVGNREGLLRLKDDQATWLVRSPGGFGDDVCAVALDRDGVIWCGFAQGGLARIVEGKVTFYRQAEGLSSNSVQSLLADDDGTLWVGTADGGLTRLKDGKFTRLGPEHGLADTIICQILDDGLDHFWMSTHHGIQRVAKDELNRCADGKIPAFQSQIYDRSDGLPIIQFRGGRQSASARTEDGRLWFAASSADLISVDPRRIRTNPDPPPVVMESFVIDGRVVPIPGRQVADLLPPDHERLEFRFSGLSYAAPNKVLFKYQLEGIDKTWIDSGAKRTAFYSRLPAGNYRFRVIACNNDGLWNLTPATLSFTIAPFFWETWWFTGSIALAAVVAVALLVRTITRRRMQRRIEQMERQHELERERARIAQDIHDDVGASLSRIAMLSQPARRDLAEPERSAAMLARIYATAREVTRSLDEIVWAVDPRHDTLDSLVDYMGRFAQEYLTAAGLRCRLDLPVVVPASPLTAETRHNLFLAFKEALHNAVKHAAATQVRISLRLQADSFELMVQDNGQGFDPAKPGSAVPERLAPGNGLANMRKRLARIGGRCEIDSAPGEGTNVSLIVALAGQGPAPPISPPLLRHLIPVKTDSPSPSPAQSTTISVVVVEDDSSIRSILKNWLEEADGFACVGVFPDVESALPKIPALKPDVAIVDINLPGLSGIECVRQLKSRIPETQFVMLTVYEDSNHIFDALSAGATGYLVKTTSRESLFAALREVHAGGSPMSGNIARKVVQNLQQQKTKIMPSDDLSKRENEVLALLAQGYLYKEIADALGIRLDTVNTYIRRIYEKLHVHSRAQAVARFANLN